MKNLLNAFGFQLGWWLCVLSPTLGVEVLALVGGAALIGLHMLFAPQAKSDFKLLVLAVLLGMGIDSVFALLDIIRFTSSLTAPPMGLPAGSSLQAVTALQVISPAWTWMIWALFALTLNHSLSFLKGRVSWAALAGLVFGPLSYIAGVKLGGAAWGDNPWGVYMIAAVWALLLPLLMTIALRWSPNR